ncbi:hypothetical protein U14_00002 [Candidatus Moduliflexus flocculans]|uniref:PilT protein domain protein n=1 Tax=Candidatus Moduliflexus flocculans TaxID=1499966 RepID=A0A0S6VP93_9BACT|nr:hypothetical protein U14_00002 [Candidatus Moduliflexus flocculans]
METSRLLIDTSIFVAATGLHADLPIMTLNLDHFQRIPDLTIVPVP